MNNMTDAAWSDPGRVFEEYRAGVRYKAALGEKGLYRQSEINERFFAGDQWHGAACGSERPLVRHNLIRRIGDYKLAVVGAGPLSVRFSADGMPDTVAARERVRTLRRDTAAGLSPLMTPQEASQLTLSALSDYFKVTAERVGLDSLCGRVLKNAYCSGTGVLYTYWDDTVPTGLYADEGRTAPLSGDLACEVLDIGQVYFGDPTEEEVQRQPYILVAQRRPVSELRRLARRYGCSADEADAIRPDRDGMPPEGEPEEAGKALLLTKFYKDYAEDGTAVLKAVQVCRGVTVRPSWELGLRLYPLAVFRWDTRPDCAYGDSEITWLIPNQIAVNRMLTASVWAMLMQGMPTLLVNGDVVSQPVTNDPGQVIRVFGTGEDVSSALRYVEPPSLSPSMTTAINGLIADTLSQSGATAAALGDVTPDNTSAIVAVREAAMLPLQTVQRQYHAFYEELARIWAEFWVCAYGVRPLRIEDEWGAWYLPFDGDACRDLLIRTRVDVGASNLWSESQSIVTLDNLLARGVITPRQYLTRLPKGTVPDVEGLLRELRDTEEAVV